MFDSIADHSADQIILRPRKWRVRQEVYPVQEGNGGDSQIFIIINAFDVLRGITTPLIDPGHQVVLEYRPP